MRVQEALDGLERVRLRNADLFDDPDEDNAESEEEPLHELTDVELMDGAGKRLVEFMEFLAVLLGDGQ